MILSFWISTRATSGVDDKERLEAVGIVCHVLNRGITDLGVTGLVSIQLVRKGVEKTISCSGVSVEILEERQWLGIRTVPDGISSV